MFEFIQQEFVSNVGDCIVCARCVSVIGCVKGTNRCAVIPTGGIGLVINSISSNKLRNMIKVIRTNLESVVCHYLLGDRSLKLLVERTAPTPTIF